MLEFGGVVRFIFRKIYGFDGIFISQLMCGEVAML